MEGVERRERGVRRSYVKNSDGNKETRSSWVAGARVIEWHHRLSRPGTVEKRVASRHWKMLARPLQSS